MTLLFAAHTRDQKDRVVKHPVDESSILQWHLSLILFKAFIKSNILWNGGRSKGGQQVIGAIQELDLELGHHTGDGTQIGIK